MTTHHPPHPPPVLLSKLHIALSCLYDGSNNNSSITHNNGVSVKEAHDVLNQVISVVPYHQNCVHGKIGLPTTPPTTTVTTITTMTDKKKKMMKYLRMTMLSSALSSLHVYHYY
jgi:hypothetical protein